MTRYVALLRAVNVGGRKVTTKELREVADNLGHTNVRTLVASGNWNTVLKIAEAPGA
ncbi:MAG: hypothetical protein B7Y90_00895 [Alphaproteobacteria bacterium 32-64-14]|nr:MAG: hypothetical protein B7Y90_00895 [Alphaproteobacteria bacterium 32-64-14]